MRAIRFSSTGGSEVLELVELPAPSLGPSEVLVDVSVAGVNFIDTYHRSGLYPVAFPSGLGGEGCGTILAIGAAVTDRVVGQRVAWSDTLGSYAEQVAVRADRCVVVPDALDDATACALMLQGMTAHYLAFSTCPLGPGHTALVYAAAGGVGRLLVQLAKQRGARVIACTSTPEKAVMVRDLGADEVLLYREVNVASEVRRLTGGVGADVVYDSVGATTWQSSLDSLRRRGLAVFFGNSSGTVPPIDPALLSQKGSLFMTRPKLADHVVDRDELEWRAGAVFGLATAGHLDVAVHDRYPLADAARAHDDLESGTTMGKLILDC